MKKGLLQTIYKKVIGRDLKSLDPQADSLIDEDRIRAIATDAMCFSEMYLSSGVFIDAAVINNNGAFFFVSVNGIDRRKAEDIVSDIRNHFSLAGGNSFIFFAESINAYLYDDKEGSLIELPDLYDSFENLYSNLLLPFVDVQYIGFNGIHDLLVSAEERVKEAKPEEDVANNLYEYNGDVFVIDDKDDEMYTGEPEYIKYLLSTEKAESVCVACAKLERNDKPVEGAYTDDEGNEYTLRHSERRIGGDTGVNLGIVGEKKWYKVSDESPDKLLLMTIFGGWFGLHKFYQGQIVDGIIYLLTCGCLGVLPVMDILMMTTGNYTYSEIEYLEDEMNSISRVKNKVYMKKPSNLWQGLLGMFIAFAIAYIASHTLYQPAYVTTMATIANKGSNMTPDEAQLIYNRISSFTDSPIFSFFK